jgi:formylglycine-generating enzyme required for sulfatase activity
MKKYSVKQEDEVRLKPIFNIPPSRYMPIALAAAVVLVLFLLFLLPGLISSSARISVNPDMSNAGIWIDGEYAGSVRSKPEIESGTYDITISKPFFEEITYTDLKVNGNVLFSLFHTRTQNLEADWNMIDLSGYADYVRTELSHWSRIDEYSDRYHYPDILTKTAQELILEEQVLNNSPQIIEQLFNDAAAYVTNITMVNDLKSAQKLLEPLFTIDQELPEMLAEHYSESSQFAATRDYLNRLDTSISEIDTPQTIRIQENTYLLVPRGSKTVLGDRSFTPGDDMRYLPYEHIVARDYYICAAEVTEIEYAQFVRENPYWAPENRRTLVSEGMVDDLYLEDINLDAPSLRPIRSISYHAARAYAEWLSSRIEGFSAELPTLRQWESALKFHEAQAPFINRLLIVEQPGAQLYGMAGSLWEFTQSPYVPVASHAPSQAQGEFMTVMGGSYVNTDAQAFSRGEVATSLCSPYIGMRIVLMEDDA